MEVIERIWEFLAGLFNGLLGRFERAITALFGSANARVLRRLQPKVDAINALEEKYKQLSNDELRGRANNLVLRSTQAALAAAKGAGFVSGHPAGRWCREALFFLVWSCPQPVVAAHLCELAGILD